MAKGLSPEHHQQLNNPEIVFPGGTQAKIALINQLRDQYREDEVAIQQIDVYDVRSEYHIHFRLLRQALLNNNQEVIEAEYAWLAEHYPDIGKKEEK
jgi:hypothetical protein